MITLRQWGAEEAHVAPHPVTQASRTMAVDPHAAGGQWPVDGGLRAVAAHRAAAVHATGDIPGCPRPKRPKRGPRLGRMTNANRRPRQK